MGCNRAGPRECLLSFLFLPTLQPKVKLLPSEVPDRALPSPGTLCRDPLPPPSRPRLFSLISSPLLLFIRTIPKWSLLGWDLTLKAPV